MSSVPQAGLEGVVARVSDGLKVSVTTKGGAERATRTIDGGPGYSRVDAILPVGSASRRARHHLAGLAHTQTEGGIPRIRLLRREQMATLGSYVSYSPQIAAAKLAVKGELEVLGPGIDILVIKTGRAANG